MEAAKSKKGWADRLAEGMEFLAPLFDQPHLASVRDGFVALMPLIIIWLSRLRLATRQGLLVGLGSGVLDAGGNTFYMLAVNVTRLDVAAVLSSMYPAGTVLLSILLLKEKVSTSQWLGVGLCIAAAALIAL